MIVISLEDRIQNPNTSKTNAQNNEKINKNPKFKNPNTSKRSPKKNNNRACGILDTFGFLDTFGHVWTRLDTFGHVWTRFWIRAKVLDTVLDFGYPPKKTRKSCFGHVWILPEENQVENPKL